MRAPTNEAGKLKIYFEKLDPILVSTINPTCFLCGHLLAVDKPAVVINAVSIIRLDRDCFNILFKGVAIFTETEKSMKVFTNELQ